MMHIDHRVFGSIAWLMLAGCGSPDSSAPANVAEDETNIETGEGAQVEPQSAPASGATPREQTNNSRPVPPVPVTTPGPPTPAPPNREIRPAPDQPPAEVDPPHRYPGDEVPR